MQHVEWFDVSPTRVLNFHHKRSRARLTRVHNFRNRLKIKNRIDRKHVSVFDRCHNISDSFLSHLQNARDDVDLILVQVVVVFCHFYKLIQSLMNETVNKINIC